MYRLSITLWNRDRIAERIFISSNVSLLERKLISNVSSRYDYTPLILFIAFSIRDSFIGDR